MELNSGISSSHQSGSPASPPTSPTSFARFSVPGVDSGYGDTSDIDSVRPSSTCPVAETDQETNKLKVEPFYYMYSDYDSFKHLAMKARQVQPDASKCRVPNLQWSGYGFSYSMPESALKINLPVTDSAEGVCDKSQSLFPYNDKFDCIGIHDHSPSASMDLMVGSGGLKGDIPNVTTLLNILGLEKYTYLFTSQEIDMTTFITLNDNDLKQLGIATFGARRKILLAINELKKDKSHFRGEAAPGAERKTSNSSFWYNFMQ
ncbi:hypothetical protein J437_LFUL014371 [Ladona fulva]|uniref:SAM domain-containing protein n=1 Tax=Ladona fulva TaxID=123851 RepID=A0A8K0KQK7_LADFU|nr:hypothetical protein J437_LFUL014371 [Ladona fulva]